VQIDREEKRDGPADAPANVEELGELAIGRVYPPGPHAGDDQHHVEKENGRD